MKMKRALREFAWKPLRMQDGGIAFLREVWNAVVVDAATESPLDETQSSAGFYRTREAAEEGLRERFPSTPFVWEPCT